MAIYYTIQSLEAFEKLKKRGFITGDEDKICDEMQSPYKWMKRQMKKRLLGYTGEQPIWLWLKKPDMRNSGHEKRGRKIVRLTVEMDENDVLVSDFSKWHIVLNDGFYFHTEKEYEDLEKGVIYISKEESWKRIFDEYDDTHAELWGERDSIILQGVTSRISIENVKKVEYFIAK